MPSFNDLYDLFKSGSCADFIDMVSKFDSVNTAEDDEPLIVYLSRIIGSNQASGKEDIFNHLVTKGVELNVHDDRQRTPLSNLAFNNNLHYFKLLVQLGADINYDGGGEAPIKRAIRSNGSIEVARFIFAHPNYIPLAVGVLGDVAKRSGAKVSIALLKELKIK